MFISIFQGDRFFIPKKKIRTRVLERWEPVGRRVKFLFFIRDLVNFYPVPNKAVANLLTSIPDFFNSFPLIDSYTSLGEKMVA